MVMALRGTIVASSRLLLAPLAVLAALASGPQASAAGGRSLVTVPGAGVPYGQLVLLSRAPAPSSRWASEPPQQPLPDDSARGRMEWVAEGNVLRRTASSHPAEAAEAQSLWSQGRLQLRSSQSCRDLRVLSVQSGRDIGRKKILPMQQGPGLPNRQVHQSDPSR